MCTMTQAALVREIFVLISEDNISKVLSAIMAIEVMPIPLVVLQGFRCIESPVTGVAMVREVSGLVLIPLFE